MGITDTIQKIQAKPESTRYKILILSVILIMSLIIGLWLTLPDRQKIASLNIGGPFKLLWQNAKTIIPFDLWQNIKTMIPNQ